MDAFHCVPIFKLDPSFRQRGELRDIPVQIWVWQGRMPLRRCFLLVNWSREKPPTVCCKVLSAFTLQNCILTGRSHLSNGAPAGGTATSSLGRLHGPRQQIWGVGHKGSFRSSSLLLAGLCV